MPEGPAFVRRHFGDGATSVEQTKGFCVAGEKGEECKQEVATTTHASLGAA